MTYPVRASQPMVAPLETMTVPFRPTLAGIVTATVIVHGRQPQVDDGGHHGGPPQVIPFQHFTIGGVGDPNRPVCGEIGGGGGGRRRHDQPGAHLRARDHNLLR